MDSDWALLPVNLLNSISEKIISTRDYSHFGAVCTSWQSVADYNAEKRINSLRHEVPFLMIQSQRYYSHDVYDVTMDRFLKSKLVAPFKKRFCGSSQGWLVSTNADFSVTLHKPYLTLNKKIMSTEKIMSTVQTIHLPCIDHVDSPKMFIKLKRRLAYAIGKAVISADPVKNPEQSMVLAMCDCSMRLAYIRPSKDTAWSYLQTDRMGYFDDIIFYNDQFYAINPMGDLVAFEATENPFNLKPKLIVKWEKRPPNIIQLYLVELNGKLLHVERSLDFDFDLVLDSKVISRTTTSVRVYELDFDEKSWKEIEGIGDHALFLGDNTSISVLASNFSGCKSNSIYFTHGNDCLGSSGTVPLDFGVYDIHTRTMDFNFNMSADALGKIQKRVPIWIEPYN